MATDSAHITTGTKERIKQYIVYTGSNMTTVYEARADAESGATCLVTTYTYVVGTNRVEKMKETVGTWISATMDI